MIHWHVHSRRDSFSGFIYHLLQNVYHKPCPLAAGHLVLADSAHFWSLRHPSVKSREQTQSKLSLPQKKLFCFFQKTVFGNTFKILCPLPWVQGPAPENGKAPLPTQFFSTPTRTRAFTGPCVLIGIVQLLSQVWHCDYMLGNRTGFPVFHYLCTFLKLTSFEYAMLSHNLILLFPILLPTVFPSIRVSSNEPSLDIIGLNVEASSSSSVLPLNIFLPLPKQNSCFQSPNNIEHW